MLLIIPQTIVHTYLCQTLKEFVEIELFTFSDEDEFRVLEIPGAKPKTEVRNVRRSFRKPVSSMLF